MASLVRRMQRKVLRDNGTDEGPPQPVIYTKDGGYLTLRPTKGWIKTSGKRVKVYSSNTTEAP